jgi:hypothetical protein
MVASPCLDEGRERPLRARIASGIALTALGESLASHDREPVTRHAALNPSKTEGER